MRRDFWPTLTSSIIFSTPSMAEILGGAAQIPTGAALAHQELRQLQRDAEVAERRDELRHPRRFRVSDDDARNSQMASLSLRPAIFRIWRGTGHLPG